MTFLVSMYLGQHAGRTIPGDGGVDRSSFSRSLDAFRATQLIAREYSEQTHETS